ncbi:MAG: hypothetical protein ABR905_11720 [Terracidiphilus sp.]|jgi:hypothetical protein
MKSSVFAADAEPEGSPAALPAVVGGQSDLRYSRAVQWAQALVLIALFTAPAVMSLRTAYVADPDVWWHLRTAEWMVEHRTVPRADSSLFSIPGTGTNWASYSWLFELLISQLFQRLGLVGIVAYSTGMAVAIAVALHRMIRRLQADFTITVLLTALACYSISRLYTPRPWLFSILFFVLELDLLLRARSTGKHQGLLWLPVIFAFWANLHIQFVDGLLVLAIALAEVLLARRWSRIQTGIRVRWMCGVSIACLLAVLLNPYGWKIYRVAYDLGTQPGVLNVVSEFQPLAFRYLGDWFVLFLALAAVATLAWARRFAFFESGLLLFAILVSFRTQRDLWVVVIAACAIVAAGVKGNEKNSLRATIYTASFILLATTFAVILAFLVLHVNNSRLRTDLAEELPVRAVESVKEKGWTGPLYNDFNWGGYLIWALRMPVGIDGRAALYGDERINRFNATWNGQPGWDSDPDLVKAGLVIGPVQAPLTQLLRTDQRFQLVYEDKLTVVFIARRGVSSAIMSAPAAGNSAVSVPAK